MRSRISLVALALATSALALYAGCGGSTVESLTSIVAARLNASTKVTAKVTYEVASAGNRTAGGEPSATTVTTVIQRPPDRRVDSSSTLNGLPVESSMISAHGRVYFCSRYGRSENGPTGPASCVVGPPGDKGIDEALDLFLQMTLQLRDAIAREGLGGAEVSALPSRNIAGVEADCFAVKGTLKEPRGDQPYDDQFCLSRDGILLSMQGSTTALQVSVEATHVGTEVTDADFEPPYPVSDLSSH